MLRCDGKQVATKKTTPGARFRQMLMFLGTPAAGHARHANCRGAKLTSSEESSFFASTKRAGHRRKPQATGHPV